MTVGLVVEIIGDASKLSKSLKGAEGDVGGFGDSVLGSVGKLAAFAGVAGAVAVGIGAMTMAAAEDEAQQQKLEAAIVAAGAATGDYKTQVEAAIAAGQDRAFTDTQTRDALQSLVTATGDVTAATGLLSAAQDIARFANVDLATAADALAKAQTGQDGPLRKLIPGLEKGATAADTIAAATARAAGQADIYANSAQGVQERAVDAFAEIGETIGSVFLPVLKEILPALIPMIKAFGQLISAVLPILIPLIRIVAQVLSTVATAIAGVVTWLVDLIGAIGRAITAIGNFLDSINPLKGISLPSFSLPFMAAAPSSAAGVRGLAAPRSTTSVGSGGITINVTTTGDTIEAEQAVLRAVRRANRLNAGLVPIAGF